MSETTSTVEQPHSNKPHDMGIRIQVQTMYLRGIRLPVIATETGVKLGTIKTWAKRYGWARTVATVQDKLEARRTTTLAIQPQPQSDQSNRLRETFANILQKHASKMTEVAAKADLKTLRKVGKALEPLVRSAKVIHNWGDSNPAGIVLTELLGHEQSPIAAAVDVDQLPCGLDTPTGCPNPN